MSGVRKINIDTDICVAMTGAMRQILAKQRGEFDPRKALIARQERGARCGQGALRSLRLCRARFKDQAAEL
jgi:fructose/tagatose bisphosphate aldolase